jgi:hypothetical protein
MLHKSAGASALVVLVLSTSGLAQPVESFNQMGRAGFLNVDRPPDCNSPTPTLTVDVDGHPVVLTTTRGGDGGQPYFMGCFQWDQTATSFHLPNDPATDPGDKRGHHQSQGSVYGDVIIDFSEPVSGFGISSLIEGLFNSNISDTIVVYDAPGGAGNVLGTATTGPRIHQRIYVDFKGVVTPTAAIRSARVLMDGDGFLIDGYAVALPAPACGSADFDGDGDVGTDADIEAFFACLAGNCCPTCFAGGADFNGDGDVGTDADIESFFRVLAGGEC